MGSDRSDPTRILTRQSAGASTNPILATQLSTAGMLPVPKRRRTRVTVIPPFDPIRRPSGTRDLGMAPVRAERKPQLAGLGDFGPATSHGEWDLICDLASPMAIGAEPCYRLGLPRAERSSAGRCYTYRWTVRRRTDGGPIWQMVTTVPELRIAAAAPGRYLVEVVALASGTPMGVRLSLDHDVELEPETLTAKLQGASTPFADAMRELVTDLRPYIIGAAAATGPRGITSRCLAALLSIEVLSRPKVMRERELDEVGALMAALERGERLSPASGALDRLLGVGQIRPMTAAMVSGAVPWSDQDRNDRRPARDQIKASYEALPLGTKQTIFTQLRWPKSNIAMAATFLSTLKNRANRYPALTRAQFAADPSAVGIVATEYVSGATLTPAAEATPSGYGSWVWHQMQETLMQQFFADD
jgi:hypothetical protein